MAEFEQAIEQAIADQDIPGCVLCAKSRDGSFNYTKSFGTRSLKPDGDRSPLQPSTIMWIASCTKLMTSICAMQLVERGAVTLDAPVYTHLPELKDHPILKDFDDDGKPILEPHTKPITLRLLLQHASGLSYDSMHPKLVRWLEDQGKGPSADGTLLGRFNAPMLFEPGEAWMYGPGIDYAGLLIERVSGKSLEEFMRENLWKPLGIKDMTFFLSRRPDLEARLADMSLRDEESGKVRYTGGRQVYQDADGKEVVDCMGGQGVFASPEEYIKVLHALLTTDADEKILKRESLEEFFRPQMAEGGVAALNALLQDDTANNAMGGTPREVVKDWGLGGLVIKGDVPSRQSEGTMIWGGLPNLIWFVDRKTGLCGLYAGQLLPTGDPTCAALDRKFETGMYEMYRKFQSQNSRL